MDSENSFGKRVKRLREEMNMTQTKLSEVTGIPQPQISKYEKGLEIPYKTNATLLARGLRTTADYLFGETEDPSPKETGDFEKAKEYLNPEKPIIPLYTKEHFSRFKIKENNSIPTSPDSPIKSLRLTEEIMEGKYGDSATEEIDTTEKSRIHQYIINDYDADYAVQMPDSGMEPLIPKGALCYIRNTNINFGDTLRKQASLLGASVAGSMIPTKKSLLEIMLSPITLITAAILAKNLPKQLIVFLPPFFEHDYMWVRKYDKENNIITPINLLDYPDDTFVFSDVLKKRWGTIGIVRGYKMNLDLRDYRKKETS